MTRRITGRLPFPKAARSRMRAWASYAAYVKGEYTDDYQSVMNQGVPETLRALKEMGVKVALASSSSKIQSTKCCRTAKSPSCSMAVSGEEFRQSKPNPEIYLHTLERLGLCATIAAAWRIPRFPVSALVRGSWPYRFGQARSGLGFRRIMRTKSSTKYLIFEARSPRAFSCLCWALGIVEHRIDAGEGDCAYASAIGWEPSSRPYQQQVPDGLRATQSAEHIPLIRRFLQSSGASQDVWLAGWGWRSPRYRGAGRRGLSLLNGSGAHPCDRYQDDSQGAPKDDVQSFTQACAVNGMHAGARVASRGRRYADAPSLAAFFGVTRGGPLVGVACAPQTACLFCRRTTTIPWTGSSSPKTSAFPIVPSSRWWGSARASIPWRLDRRLEIARAGINEARELKVPVEEPLFLFMNVGFLDAGAHFCYGRQLLRGFALPSFDVLLGN